MVWWSNPLLPVPGGGQVPTIGQARLIAWTLVGGQLMFGVVLLVLASLQALPVAAGSVAGLELFGWIAVAVAGVLLPLAYVVRGQVWKPRSAAPDAAEQRAAYVRGAVLFLALLEGGVLLNLIAVLLLPEPWLNIAAAALLFAVTLVSLPSEDQFSNSKA